jgi:hypothetical protein
MDVIRFVIECVLNHDNAASFPAAQWLMYPAKVTVVKLASSAQQKHAKSAVKALSGNKLPGKSEKFVAENSDFLSGFPRIFKQSCTYKPGPPPRMHI